MPEPRSAAIVTVGSELVEGLRVDTNTAHIARRVTRLGFRVGEATSVGDDAGQLAKVLARLTRECDLVLVTGGLGPTHDDITREAAAEALGLELATDPAIADQLASVVERHVDPASRVAVLTQALVLDGAEVLAPVTGTAPGQVASTPAGALVLLPGPPSEMGEMLERALSRYETASAEPRELGVTGMPESDVQHAAQRALAAFEGVVLTVLARPGDVRVVLLDDGAGAAMLEEAAEAVAREIGPNCYTSSGATLAQATLSALFLSGQTVATAESCTGGLIAASLTDVSGASGAFLGGVVAYSNEIKADLLDVPDTLLAQFGAVSEQSAAAMAEGARARLHADIAVSVTGIAGPEGGTTEKPVGLVWFGLAHAGGTFTVQRRFLGGSRDSVRARATATGLDLVRRQALDL